MPAAVERVEQVVDPPRRGHAGGVAERQPVGARVDAGARRAARPVRGATSPSYGQPNAVDTIASTGDARARARARRHRARRRATRRPSAARSSGCASRSRSRRARSRRPPPRWRARRPSRSGTSAEYTTPGPAGDPGHHLVGAGHRRDRGRRHERAASIRRSPVRRQRVDQPDPVGDRHRRLVLQAVARPDLTDLDALRPGGHHDRLRGPNRRSPVSVPLDRLHSSRRRTRSLIGVGPRSNDSRSLRSR